MTSATNIAILSACAALVTVGCAPKRVLPDSSSVPTDALSTTAEKSSDDYSWLRERSMVDHELASKPAPPQSLEERIRVAKDRIKRTGDHFPEIIASDDHDTLLSIEGLFSAMRGLVNDPKRWFQRLGFSANSQVLFLGTGNEKFLWVVVTSDDVSIGSRVFRKPATIYLFQTLIQAISPVCNEFAGGNKPDGVLGMQRATPDYQLATTIDFSCGPITVELYGVRGSNKYSLDLIRSSDSPLRKSINEPPPK